MFEAVVLERYGRPAAVLVSPERYEQLLEALDEAEDVAAFDAAMAEEGKNIRTPPRTHTRALAQLRASESSGGTARATHALSSSAGIGRARQ